LEEFEIGNDGDAAVGVVLDFAILVRAQSRASVPERASLLALAEGG